MQGLEDAQVSESPQKPQEAVHKSDRKSKMLFSNLSPPLVTYMCHAAVSCTKSTIKKHKREKHRN